MSFLKCFSASYFKVSLKSQMAWNLGGLILKIGIPKNDNIAKKKIEIANELKYNSIYPLPLEFEKKITEKSHFALCESDPDQIAYKKNTDMASDKLLEKYCSTFEINNIKKLRLLFQDFIFEQQMRITGKLGVWSSLYPKKKIVYVSFRFRCFYNTDTSKNISKIIIPLDFIDFFIKRVKKTFNSTNTPKQKNRILETNGLDNFFKKKVAFIPHKGISYGNKNNMLFDKSIYYSNDKNSLFYKNNILHLEYSNYEKPDKDLCWLSFSEISIPNFKIYLKTLLSSIKNIYLIRSWSTFLVWVFFIHKYNEYLKYFYKVKKFKNLKLAILDYDILCPKSLVLAFKKNNVKVVATQERFLHTFYTSYANVIVDTYFTASEFTANFIKKSKYYDIKNVLPVGQYKANYLTSYKGNISDEVIDAKQKGKKILVILGYAPPENWFESYISLQSSWSSQIKFLKEAIKLSESLKNTFIIIRYKSFKCPIRSNPYFQDVVNEINKLENIILANNYNESFYSYKLCANADLVIAKPTTLADECLSAGIPVLFYEYTHNMKGIQTKAYDYDPPGLRCYSIDELVKKSKSILFDKKSNHKNEISDLIKKIYQVKDKDNTKNKIIRYLENMIN